jgi:preprotein translocase subunit SecE
MEGNQVGSMVQDEPKGEVVAKSDAAAPREKKLGFFARIALFIRQVFAELRKVVTPTRQELMKFTAVVLAFVVVMMALVYGLDLLFVWLTTVVFGVPAGA